MRNMPIVQIFNTLKELIHHILRFTFTQLLSVAYVREEVASCAQFQKNMPGDVTRYQNSDRSLVVLQPSVLLVNVDI